MKLKKKLLLVMKTQDFLSKLLLYLKHIAVLIISTMLYITPLSMYLSYNWKFVLFDLQHYVNSWYRNSDSIFLFYAL